MVTPPKAHSLSWYKKRTAALNKALGTKYRPTEIYEAEQKRHINTEIGKALESFGDPRSKAAKAQLQLNVAVLVQQQWSALAAANAYVFYVSNSIGEYLSADGSRIYEQLADGRWQSIEISSGAIEPLEGPPPEGSIYLSPKTANDLLKAKAQDLKPFKNRKGESINNYFYQ